MVLLSGGITGCSTIIQSTTYNQGSTEIVLHLLAAFVHISVISYERIHTLQPHCLKVALRTCALTHFTLGKSIPASKFITTNHILENISSARQVDFRLLCIISFFILQYLFIFTSENPKNNQNQSQIQYLIVLFNVFLEEFVQVACQFFRIKKRDLKDFFLCENFLQFENFGIGLNGKLVNFFCSNCVYKKINRQNVYAATVILDHFGNLQFLYHYLDGGKD